MTDTNEILRLQRELDAAERGMAQAFDQYRLTARLGTAAEHRQTQADWFAACGQVDDVCHKIGGTV